MRRLITASVTAALLIGSLAMPVAAAGPSCSHILPEANDGSFESTAAYNNAENTVFGLFFTDGASCQQVTYTLYVLEDANSSTPTWSASVVGDGSHDYVEILVEGVDTDNDVCVYVTATIGKKKITDRGPDTGCVYLFDDGSSGGGGKGF